MQKYLGGATIVRIDELKTKQSLQTKNKRTKNTAHKSSISPFSQMLSIEETEFEDIQIELEQIRAEIEEVGSALEDAPSLKEFNKFRDLIRVLTQKVSKQAYKSKTIIGRCSNKKYQIIQTVNTDLNDLYRLILSEQKNRIAIASKIIKLKGLVLDLLY